MKKPFLFSQQGLFYVLTDAIRNYRHRKNHRRRHHHQG